MALYNSVTCSADPDYVHGRVTPRVKYETIRNDYDAGLGDLNGVA